MKMKFNDFLAKDFVIHVFLLLLTAGIYSIYYSSVFLDPNGVLSSITDDSLKNYYTYAFHAKYAQNPLHFSGFNYPFGDHIVFTDGQPLLSILLHYLPFTHPYLIGVLHFLLFFSYFITPSLIFILLRKLEFPKLYAIPVAIAVTLLSPQFYRIYAGHYALAYTCLIPFYYLLLLRYWNKNSRSSMLVMSGFNFLVFLIHPYFGLGFSLFSAAALLLYDFISKNFKWATVWKTFWAGLFPIVLFQLFMLVTDKHPQRPGEPFGSEEFISTAYSFLLPYNGPFKNILESVFGVHPAHFEGYCYLGFATLLYICIFIVLAVYAAKHLSVRKDILAIFISSLFFVLLAIGFHFKILDKLHLKISALNQFRSVGRFSWFLYFSLPLFLFSMAHATIKKHWKGKFISAVFVPATLIYLLLHLWEADSYFNLYGGYWQDRNVFNEKCLNNEERTNISEMKEKKVQAIFPVPIYFVGSEVYDRSNCSLPLIISTIYSYHTGLPILSSYASRSSLPETVKGINIINSYLKDNPVRSSLNPFPVFTFVTNESLMPDEERMASKLKVVRQNDSLSFGYFDPSEIFKPVIDSSLFELRSNQSQRNDSAGIIYIVKENRHPYIESDFQSYEMALILDSNQIASGDYIVSIHFYPSGKTFREMSGALIVTKAKGNDYVWQDIMPLKIQSGFYKDFGVIERKVHLEKDSRYEFMINGGNATYRISHFLLRPQGTTIRALTEKGDTLYNNYPAYSAFTE